MTEESVFFVYEASLWSTIGNCVHWVQCVHALSKVCTLYSTVYNVHGVPSRVDDLSVENSTTTVSPTLR